MTKKVIQDIIVKSKAGQARAPFLERKRGDDGEQSSVPHPPHTHNNRIGSVGWKSYAVLAVLLIALGAFTIGRFVKATVTITPRQTWLPVDIVLSADAGSTTGLALQTLTLSDEASSRVVATDATHIKTYATGEIVVYNAFNASPQTLIGHATDKSRQTRFEAPNGKIYRIRTSVTVPGMKGTTPGEVTVTVYADEPGEEYNGDRTDFTIPGFKGTPRFNGFYARSKTPMTGGFSGVALALTRNDIDTAVDGLTNSLKASLLKSVREQVPDGFTLYQDAVRISVTPSDRNPSGGEKADDALVVVNGEATGYLLPTDKLVDAIVADNKDLFADTGTVTIANIDELKFAFVDTTLDDSSMGFTLSGKGHFVWETDEHALLSELRTAGRGAYASVFGARPYIKTANISFNPSWWPWLPKSDSRVEFDQVLEVEAE